MDTCSFLFFPRMEASGTSGGFQGLDDIAGISFVGLCVVFLLFFSVDDGRTLEMIFDTVFLWLDAAGIWLYLISEEK